MSLNSRTSSSSPAASSSPLWVSVTSCVFAAVVVGFMLSLTGCKETDADKIGDAQACIDKYSKTGSGDLTVCESKVDGLTSPAAYGIRCAVGFIKEGFGSAQSFIDAFEQIETVDATAVANFLLALAFDSAGDGNSTNIDANYTAASRTYGYCASSQAKGATLIGTFSYITNLLFKYECDSVIPGLGSCDMTDTALGLALAAGFLDVTAPTLALQAELGTIVMSTNSVSCSSGASNEQLCEFMERAITGGGGTPAGVGKEFLNVIANP